MRGIKITTDNKVSIVDIDTSDYHQIIDCIGCDIFETVVTDDMIGFFCQPVRMICDEEGLLNDSHFNRVGSWFYGYHNHRHPIFGDVLFLQQCGPELIGLDDVEEYFEALLNHFPVLEADE